jgi:hypothetical protein
MNWREEIPLNRSLLLIFFLTLLISGSAALALFYQQQLAVTRSRSPDYQLRILAQTSSRKESLPSVYLEELLGLSQDRPLSLYQLDTKEAERRLLASPLIASARVRHIPPHTLHVDYDVRDPVAYLADMSEVALDAQGIAIPVQPFTTPKKLPELYLGELEPSSIHWGQTVGSSRLDEALALLKLLTEQQSIPGALVRRIDMADAWLPWGRGQVLVLLEDEVTVSTGAPHRVQQWLRFNPHSIQSGWDNYRKMRPKLMEQMSKEPSTAPILVDLRLPTLAYWRYQ